MTVKDCDPWARGSGEHVIACRVRGVDPPCCEALQPRSRSIGAGNGCTLVDQVTRDRDVPLLQSVLPLVHSALRSSYGQGSDRTETEYEELEALFGADIASLVAEVTDDKSLPKAERKRRQIVGAPSASARAKLLKIADKTSNLRTLVSSPPANWDVARVADYIDWAERVVAGCRGTNATLERAFDAAVTDARAAVAKSAA